MILKSYLNISLKILYPVKVSDVKPKHLLILITEFRPELVHVVMAPLPAVGGEGLQGLGGLLHQSGDLHKERFAPHQFVDDVHYLSRSIVKPKLLQLAQDEIFKKSSILIPGKFC